MEESSDPPPEASCTPTPTIRALYHPPADTLNAWGVCDTAVAWMQDQGDNEIDHEDAFTVQLPLFFFF